MAAQSFAMGQAFGTSFQYGKRKISSMSNEEFNKLDATQAHLDIQHDITQMIPAMNESFDRMKSFQIDILKSMLDTIKEGAEQFWNWVSQPTSSQQTSTSFSSFDEQGTATDIAFYGGSTGLLTGLLKGLEPGTQQFIDTQNLIDKIIQEGIDIATLKSKKTTPQITKKHIHDVSHHFQPSTQTFQDPSKIQGFGTSKSLDQIKKDNLNNNLKFWNQKLIQQNNLLKRLLKLKIADTSKLRLRSTSSKSKRAQLQRSIKNNNIESNKLRNTIKDTTKKIANIKTQLRNIR